MQAITDPFTAKILSALISLATPGNSIFSKIPIPTCSIECQKTNLCENKNFWQCNPPSLDNGLYNRFKTDFAAQGLSGSLLDEKAKERAYTRPESYDEALVRYAIIAESIANVSNKFSLRSCLSSCGDNAACQEECKNSATWIGKKEELAFMMLIAANQESGFRADVHGGTGDYGRGDCEWEKDGKSAEPFSKGAHPLKETCKSFCLGQIKVGKGTTINNWTAEDLLGIDYDSTERCFTVVADYMSKSLHRCIKWNKVKKENWIRATFSAYGSGVYCTLHKSKNIDGVKNYAYMTVDNKIVWSPFVPDNAVSREPLDEDWPKQRERLFVKFYKRDNVLKESDANRLQQPDLVSAYNYLKTNKTEWMVSL